MIQLIDQATLKSVLEYTPATGEFVWISKNPFARKLKVGSKAGRSLKSGYIQIGIDGRYYLAHRLAFLYMTGTFPSSQIDHINGTPSDNRWENLRAVTPSENSRNCAKSKRNSSGVTGVTWNHPAKKWIASISTEGTYHHLGCFDCLEDARAARKKAEQEFQFHPNHGRLK